MTVLVVAEMKNGAPTALTQELLGLAQTIDAAVMAIAFTDRADAVENLITHGVERVYWCEQREEYDGELWLALVEQIAREIAPAAVFAGHTTSGADLAPRLAF